MPNATNTLVVSSQAPSFFEDDVTFTATVSGSPQLGTNSPTGTCTFFDGVINLGTFNVVPTGLHANTSIALFETAGLTVGTHSIAAVYSGDVNYTTSTSNTLLQQVQPQPIPQNILVAFGLVASFSPLGDTSLPPQASLESVPATTHAHVSITLLWNTVNVGQVQITGNNGIDSAFDTGLLATSGTGAFVIGNGFTATITLVLHCFDKVGNPLPVSSQTTIIIS